MSTSLGIPENADKEPEAQELLRLWTTANGERVALHVDGSIPVEGWGIMLADLARHLANAYAQKGHGSIQDNYREILASFLLEAGDPTDTVSGSIE